MTEGQIRFQTIMENQRHNLAMEKLGNVEANIKQQQADTAARQATTAERQADIAHKAEQRHWWERFDNNLWQGGQLFYTGVKEATNFLKTFMGALFK